MPAINVSEDKDKAADSSFTLRNASGNFEGRSSNIFGQLDVLERQHISHEQSRTDLEDYADLRQEKDDGDFAEGNRSLQKTDKRKRDDNVPNRRGDCSKAAPDAVESTSSDSSSEKSDSIQKDDMESGERRPPRRDPQFRQPSGRPPGRGRGHRGRVPDHGKRPHTWTHYSLEDVKGSDLSEKSNSQAALAFLDEQRKLKAQEEEGMEEEEAFDVESAACSKGLFSFAKRTKTDKPSPAPGKEKPDKNQISVIDTEDQPEEENFATSSAEVAKDSVQTLEEETAEASSSATKKDDTAQTSFKSRKGIRRNIRTRDDDD
ncbi:hypothetical protein ACOMHN_018371 [Nucella lapillus]